MGLGVELWAYNFRAVRSLGWPLGSLPLAAVGAVEMSCQRSLMPDSIVAVMIKVLFNSVRSVAEDLAVKSPTLSIALLASVAVLSGAAPALQGSAAGPTIAWRSVAIAQPAPQADEMTRFRDTKKSIEILRLQTVGDIKKLIGSVPPIRCHDASTLTSLSPEVKTVVVNFCNKSKELVQDSKIPVNRFNQLLMEEQVRLQQQQTAPKKP